MSKRKNAVANGSPKKYSDHTSNLDPFRPIPFKAKKEVASGKEVSAFSVPKISIVLILDDMGARTTKRIPRSILRNLDMFRMTEEEGGVLMLVKLGTNTFVAMSEVITDDLHPLETIREKPFDDYYGHGDRSHHHKRLTKLNSGEVVRKMDRQLMRSAFAA
jgi:hypothetical protein